MIATVAQIELLYARICRIAVLVALTVSLSPLTAHAADDTARFYGTWQAHILVNGQKITVISIHDANGYHNFVRTPSGDTPAGDGTFSAKNGAYRTSAPAPNNGGVYYFVNNDTAVCTNLAGQIVTWRRIDQPTSPSPSMRTPRRTMSPATTLRASAPALSLPIPGLRLRCLPRPQLVLVELSLPLTPPITRRK